MEKTVSEIVNNRASCRAYSKRLVPEKILNEIIDEGLKVASAGNFQAYSIINIIEGSKRKKLAELSGQSVVEKAPVLLMFCIDLRRVKHISDKYPCPLCNTNNFADFWMYLLDVGMFIQNIVMVAESKGLSTVCIGNPINYMDKMSDIVRLPELVCPVLLLCMGYPAYEKRPMPKYNRKIIFHTDRYEDYPMDILNDSFQEHFRGWTKKITEKDLAEFRDTCLSWKDNKYAENAVESVRNAGTFNYYQYFLGIGYKIKSDMMDNEDYKSYFQKQGFGWFE